MCLTASHTSGAFPDRQLESRPAGAAPLGGVEVRDIGPLAVLTPDAPRRFAHSDRLQ